MFAVSAAVLLALLFFAYTTQPASAEDPKCGLLPDCTFDKFYGDEGACSALWKCDNPGGIGLTEHEGWPSGPSLTFAGDAPFDRKVFQRVAVTPEEIGLCGCWQVVAVRRERVVLDPRVEKPGDEIGSARFTVASKQAP